MSAQFAAVCPPLCPPLRCRRPLRRAACPSLPDIMMHGVSARHVRPEDGCACAIVCSQSRVAEWQLAVADHARLSPPPLLLSASSVCRRGAAARGGKEGAGEEKPVSRGGAHEHTHTQCHPRCPAMRDAQCTARPGEGQRRGSAAQRAEAEAAGAPACRRRHPHDTQTATRMHENL